MSNSKEFKTKNEAGEEITLLVKRPNAKQIREAQVVYNQAYAEALHGGAIFRKKLHAYLKKQNLWDDEREKQYQEITDRIEDGRLKLAAGGMAFKAAHKLALDMKRARIELRELISDRTEADSHTVEGQADNTRFNYLVSVCTVYSNNGNPYFSGLDDYLEKASTSAAADAAYNLASIVYGLDNNFEAEYPENKFLKEFGFINDKLHFVNKEGKLVDEDGKLVDENGRYINEKNEFIDRDGRRVDETGEFVIERKPFLDDDGNPMS
jgi:hypothetical protein